MVARPASGTGRHPRDPGTPLPVTPAQPLRRSALGSGLLEPGGCRGSSCKEPVSFSWTEAGAKSACRGISAARWSGPGAPPAPLGHGLSPCTEPKRNQADRPAMNGAWGCGMRLQSCWLRAVPARCSRAGLALQEGLNQHAHLLSPASLDPDVASTAPTIGRQYAT